MTTPTPETEAAIVEVIDEEATRKAGSDVTAIHRRWVRPDFARRLERERDEARQQRDALASTLETYRLRSRCHSPEIDEQAVKLLAEHKAHMGGKKG